MDLVAQLVRASDCGSEGRGFETHRGPKAFPSGKAFFVVFSDYQKKYVCLFLFTFVQLCALFYPNVLPIF